MSSALSHYYTNIDKIFTINFTLLAFIITAITILLMVQKGMIVKFRKANLLADTMRYFYKSLNFNFISGIFGLIIWFLNFKSTTFVPEIVSIISIFLVGLSLYYTYQSYKFLIFFVENQK